jgi:hypothetical protein
VNGEPVGLGKFAAMNLTPGSMRLEMRATLRAKRSSVAMMGMAPRSRHRRLGEARAVVLLAALDPPPLRP